MDAELFQPSALICHFQQSRYLTTSWRCSTESTVPLKIVVRNQIRQLSLNDTSKISIHSHFFLYRKTCAQALICSGLWGIHNPLIWGDQCTSFWRVMRHLSLRDLFSVIESAAQHLYSLLSVALMEET
ncbi:conserved hypothetical protein [Trichinella spiralis]|uniref:hypothetical protein n=1 Tax=Trichinella spiralis TaxID=6334 RepID=UPI0001EFC0B3|nr:conserved hypothetical protein [Trichinella spiralis]